MNGLEMAALYGLKPQELGFCGPKEKQTNLVLSNFLQGKSVKKNEVRDILRQFASAFGYLKLIARKNHIKDPFNLSVVEAYWIGNELLDKVTLEDLRGLVINEFTKPGLLKKEDAEKKVANLPEGSLAHHSWHVMVLGAISGRIVIKGDLIDLCRIGWGRVVKVGIGKVFVQYKPLIGGKQLRFGREIVAEIYWDQRIIPEIESGDLVTFHWKTLCQKISPRQSQNLEKFTQKTLQTLKRMG